MTKVHQDESQSVHLPKIHEAGEHIPLPHIKDGRLFILIDGKNFLIEEKAARHLAKDIARLQGQE